MLRVLAQTPPGAQSSGVPDLVVRLFDLAPATPPPSAALVRRDFAASVPAVDMFSRFVAVLTGVTTFFDSARIFPRFSVAASRDVSRRLCLARHLAGREDYRKGEQAINRASTSVELMKMFSVRL